MDEVDIHKTMEEKAATKEENFHSKTVVEKGAFLKAVSEHIRQARKEKAMEEKGLPEATEEEYLEEAIRWVRKEKVLLEEDLQEAIDEARCPMLFRKDVYELISMEVQADSSSSKPIQGTATAPLIEPKTDESPESPINHLSSSNLSHKRKAMEANLLSSPSSDDESPKHQKDASQEHPMDDALSSKQMQGTDTTPLKGPKTTDESPEDVLDDSSDDDCNPIDLVPDYSELDKPREHQSPTNKADLSSSNLCEPSVIGVRKAMDESQEHPKDESPKPRTSRKISYQEKMFTAMRKMLLEEQAKQEAKRRAIVGEETTEEADDEEYAEEDDEESEEEENINYGTCDVCCKENVHWTYNCPYLTYIPNPTETKVGPRYDITCKCHTRMGRHPDPREKGWVGRAIKKYCGRCSFPDHWYEDCPIRAQMLQEQKKQEQILVAE